MFEHQKQPLPFKPPNAFNPNPCNTLQNCKLSWYIYSSYMASATQKQQFDYDNHFVYVVHPNKCMVNGNLNDKVNGLFRGGVGGLASLAWAGPFFAL